MAWSNAMYIIQQFYNVLDIDKKVSELEEVVYGFDDRVSELESTVSGFDSRLSALEEGESSVTLTETSSGSDDFTLNF